MTAFFVPGAGPDRAEDRYRDLAALAGAEATDPGDRLRSVRFTHGAEEWTAAVGDPLRGRLAARTDRRPTRRSTPTRDVTDPATVLAVFAATDGVVVVTDAPPVGSVDDSTWDNPVRVPGRDIREILRFRGPTLGP